MPDDAVLVLLLLLVEVVLDDVLLGCGCVEVADVLAGRSARGCEDEEGRAACVCEGGI